MVRGGKLIVINCTSEIIDDELLWKSPNRLILRSFKTFAANVLGLLNGVAVFGSG